MAITIRHATPSDLSSVASLMHESFVEYRSSYTDAAFAATTPASDQLAKRMAEGPMWVAVSSNCGLPIANLADPTSPISIGNQQLEIGNVEDTVLVGTASALPLGDELYIRGMAVLPQSRGLGLGELLLKTIEDYALAQGYKRLTLSTTPFLLRAIRLYEGFGFQRIADGPHELFGTPLFTMAKQLVD